MFPSKTGPCYEQYTANDLKQMARGTLALPESVPYRPCIQCPAKAHSTLALWCAGEVYVCDACGAQFTTTCANPEKGYGEPYVWLKRADTTKERKPTKKRISKKHERELQILAQSDSLFRSKGHTQSVEDENSMFD